MKSSLIPRNHRRKRSSSAFELGRDKINFAIGRRRLNRFHTISIRSVISGYFQLMETLGFQFLLKAETREILVIAHPFSRKKIAMLGTNV